MEKVKGFKGGKPFHKIENCVNKGSIIVLLECQDFMDPKSGKFPHYTPPE